MIRLDPQRALFGAPLVGDALVKYAYMDEAGISERETVSVVLGVIVDADKQWRLAEAQIIEAVKTVPKHIIESGFVFSAKGIWGNPKYRDGWSDEERIEFLLRMMSIPRHLRIPICLGFHRRGVGHDPQSLLTPLGLSNLAPHQMDHLIAFLDCVLQIEGFMNDRTPANEVATLTAEDVPELKHFMKKMMHVLQRAPLPEVPLVRRIINQIQFQDKDDSPILWLADACAFAFRRFLAGEPTGDRFVEAVVGSPLAQWPAANGEYTFVFGE